MKRAAEGSAAARLAELGRRYGLGDRQTERLQEFITVLAQDEHAPTAVRDPDQTVDVHVADSLSALPMLDEALERATSSRVADVGSGAGLPGVPLAVARPSLDFDLVEATRRKCSFLIAVAERLGLANVHVRCTRAEELPGAGAREAYGAVIVRAVAPLATLVEYASPLLELGGSLLAWKGQRDPDEEHAGGTAGLQVGLEQVEVQPVTPYEQSRNRNLYLYRKVSPCPPGFPRRPGRAERAPLG